MTTTYLTLLKHGSLAALAILLAACSSVDEQNMTPEELALKAKNEQAMADAGFKCEGVRVTGSHIPTRRCSTKQQREERARSDQRAIDEWVRGTSMETSMKSDK